MFSVTDRDTQYFLAEASCPSPQSSNGRAFEHDEGLLFAGGDAVPKKGRICEVGVSDMVSAIVTDPESHRPRYAWKHPPPAHTRSSLSQTCQMIRDTQQWPLFKGLLTSGFMPVCRGNYTVGTWTDIFRNPTLDTQRYQHRKLMCYGYQGAADSE